jgi:hypothetical protein
MYTNVWDWFQLTCLKGKAINFLLNTKETMYNSIFILKIGHSRFSPWIFLNLNCHLFIDRSNCIELQLFFCPTQFREFNPPMVEYFDGTLWSSFTVFPRYSWMLRFYVRNKNPRIPKSQLIGCFSLFVCVWKNK